MDQTVGIGPLIFGTRLDRKCSLDRTTLNGLILVDSNGLDLFKEYLADDIGSRNEHMNALSSGEDHYSSSPAPPFLYVSSRKARAFEILAIYTSIHYSNTPILFEHNFVSNWFASTIRTSVTFSTTAALHATALGFASPPEKNQHPPPKMTKTAPPFLSILLFNLPFHVNSQTINDQEQPILLSLKQYWSNPSSINHWAASSNSATHCTWPEITCTGGSVTGITLVNINITGDIPPFIWDLKNLTTIDLSDNEIPGPFCYRNLQYFDLSQNFFVGLRFKDDNQLQEIIFNQICPES
ncbi:hypothetical protein LguiB_018407 [Lonicera macranthoides]